MQISGHKNVQSVNNYSSLSYDQQVQISNALTETISNTETVTSEPAVSTPVEDGDVFPDTEMDEIMKTIDTYETENIAGTGELNLEIRNLSNTVPSVVDLPVSVDVTGNLNKPIFQAASNFPQFNFAGASFNGNVTFAVNYNQTKKFRRIRVIESDSDSE